MTPAKDRYRLLPLILGLALALPALGVGLLFDDLAYRVAVERGIDGADVPPYGLYDFTPGEGDTDRWRDRAYIPWWTADDFSLRFFRPLSSVLL